jgi:hypothetical protein
MRQAQINYLKSFWGELEQAAEELLDEGSMPALSDEDFYLYHQTGNRLVYEKVYFKRRKYLTVFGILAEYEKHYTDKLIEVVSDICDEKFWALPAHVDFDSPDENTIDLFATETAGTLAEMLVIFGKAFPDWLIGKVTDNILRRVLTPFCTSDFPYSWWENDRCNWSAVCAGNIGMAAIYLNRLGAMPDGCIKPCIERVCGALDCYLGGMEEDGACTEGLYYFSYGMSYYTSFAELLYEESGGKIDLMKKDKCEQVALFQQKCYFGGVSLSFSDAGTADRFLVGLTSFLASKFSKVTIPDYALARGINDDDCYRWVCNERNIRWLIKYGKDKDGVDEDIDNRAGASYDLLPSAQWLICKDKNGNGFAAKGGNNDENHNHNDVGSFLVVYGGDMVIADLGAGEYTKDYFGAGRYDILCNRSLGHNVPVINDTEQHEGSGYRADGFIWNEEDKSLRISFAGAYEKGIVDSLTRTITADFDSVETKFKLQVSDTVLPNDKTKKFTENIVSLYKPVICNSCERGTGIININGTYITIKGVVNIRVIPKGHSMHDGTKVTAYLIQCDVDGLKSGMEKTVKMEVACGYGY